MTTILRTYTHPFKDEILNPYYRFQYPRTKTPWPNRIPIETDVLITHTPPRYHLGLDLGCDGLLQELWRVKPRLHICGHIHSGHGRRKLFWDESQTAYERLLASSKNGILGDLIPSSRWLDAVKVTWYSLTNLVRAYVGRPVKEEGGLLINAAMVYRNTTKIGNPPEVVEL
jgi:hypothetical protein